MDMAGSVFAAATRRHAPSAEIATAAFSAGAGAAFREIFSYRGGVLTGMSRANPLETMDGASVAPALHGGIEHFRARAWEGHGGVCPI